MKYYAIFNNREITEVVPKTDRRVQKHLDKFGIFCCDNHGNGVQGLDPCPMHEDMLYDFGLYLPDNATAF